MSYALLFPGQGTLHGDVLPWLDTAVAAKPLLTAVAAAVGPDWRSRLGDAEWRSTNAIAQPLVIGLSLAAWQAIAGLLPAPEIVAGYSVGELAALACAGVVAPQCAVDLAGRRAAMMDAAMASTGAAGLMAVDLPRASDFDALYGGFGVQPAIDQAPGRCIVGGTDGELTRSALWIAERGGLARRLEVQVPSHTQWMRPAAEAFGVHLASITFERPQCHVVPGASAAATRDPLRLREALAAQIATPVRWRECSAAIAERGVDCVLEVGPGQALARLWRAAHPDIPARSVDEFREPGAAADWVLAQMR